MNARAAALLGVVALGLGAASTANAARFAVGIAPSANRGAVSRQLHARGATSIADLAPIDALAVTAPSAAVLRGIEGERYVEALGARSAAYVPNDPLFPRQWYATQNRSFDAWTEPPPLAGVRVAVIDSGIDARHPEFQGRIAASRSFVGGSATVDSQGHGTFVAGLIAANTNDEIGIAGLAPSAELLIAKVVGPERAIPIEAEAKAIRWAVDNDARIINMSLSGLRDPHDPNRDSYSKLEADAVAYAVSKGVLVIAAVGNSDQSPAEPWPYAGWPSALPHVVGVSALNRKGGAPRFSNRDPQFNDIAAPGEDIISTFPRKLTSAHPNCVEQGYSPCGPEEYRAAEGTSFAAPQVTAAAAMLLATSPNLTADQVATLLSESAVDSVAATGCAVCTAGHDRFTGAGRLDQAAAIELLANGVPPPDRYEPNDDGGSSAYPLYGTTRQVIATLDYWNDRDDIYRVYLHEGERLVVDRATDMEVSPVLGLWRPGTTLSGPTASRGRRLAVVSAASDLRYRAPAAGWYLLDVRLVHATRGEYRILVSKSR